MSSSEAAALSRNHTNLPEVGLTICAGSDEQSVPALFITDLTAPALVSPDTTTATLDAELITGKVNVILSGGGFGESVRKVTHSSFSLSASWSGNSEATWPWGPIPRRTRSNLGQSLISDTSIMRVRTSCRIVNSYSFAAASADTASFIECTWLGITGTWRAVQITMKFAWILRAPS